MRKLDEISSINQDKSSESIESSSTNYYRHQLIDNRSSRKSVSQSAGETQVIWPGKSNQINLTVGTYIHTYIHTDILLKVLIKGGLWMDKNDPHVKQFKRRSAAAFSSCARRRSDEAFSQGRIKEKSR